MKPQTLRHLIIALLMFTGIFHLATAILGASASLVAPLAAFGFIYTGLAFYVRRDVHRGSAHNGRTAILLTIAVTAIGLTLGGWKYLNEGGPFALPIMFAIDVVIIAAGVLWLFKTQRS